VAIKVLLSERLLDERERMQLAHEARAVARIGHAGVVEVYDLGELDDGSAFIVMEYLTGRSLADEIATHGRGTPRQVASLTRQVAAALAAAHRTGVVHRDLKPQNVFLLSSPDGITAKLLDFGVARVGLAEAVSISLGGRMFGTPAYMAPELIQGQVADPRSDLYALAAVLFEALTGQRLVRPRASVAAVLAAVLEDPLPNASTVVAGLPRRVDELFCWALSRDPAARPADLEAWAEELAVLLEEVDGVQSPGAGWPEPITIEQPGARRRPAMVEVS
jgi:serine/threonine-protein kinase